MKLWMALKKYGEDGCIALANDAMDKATYLIGKVKEQPDKFTMINEPMGTNVGFSYTPPAFRGKEYTDAQKTSVHKIIFDRMNE